MKTNFTAAEFIAYAEKKGLQLHAIKKETPPGSGRWLLFGFEYSKRSRKYKQKYMLMAPVDLNQLKNGPIKKSVTESTATTDSSAGVGSDTPAISSSIGAAVGNDQNAVTGHDGGGGISSRIRSFVGACVRKARGR